jgi:hypothetical protein
MKETSGHAFSLSLSVHQQKAVYTTLVATKDGMHSQPFMLGKSISLRLPISKEQKPHKSESDNRGETLTHIRY